MATCPACGRASEPPAPCAACGAPTARILRSSNEVHPLARWSAYCSAGGFIAVPALGPLIVALLGPSLRRLLFVFMIGGPIAGLILARRFRAVQAADPTVGGETWARAGWVIGWVGLGITAAILALTIGTRGAWGP